MEEFKSFYKKVDGNEGSKCKYPTRLDTYGCGCSHDCKYCYAKSLLSFRKLWKPEQPRVADIKKIEKIIKKIPAGSVVRLGGMTDCFQPIEAEYEVTYKTIQLLNKQKVNYLIVTKSDLVAEDKYISILDKQLAHIQVTVTTTDDDKSLTYEKAVVPSRRIKAIEKLYDNGFDVAIRLSPYIKEYIDINKITKVRCEKMIVEFLRINAWIKQWFDVNVFEYTVRDGNYYHLPLEKKIALVRELQATGKVISVCEDEDRAYQYWKESFNPKEDCCNLNI